MEDRQQQLPKQPDTGPRERSRWVAGRRTIAVVAAGAVAVTCVQLAQPATAGPAPVAAAVSVAQPPSTPSFANVTLGHATRSFQALARPGCKKVISGRQVTVSLPSSFTDKQVQTATVRLQSRLAQRPAIDVTNLRPNGKTMVGTLVSEEKAACGRILKEITAKAILPGLAADVAAAAVFLTVSTTLLTLGLVAEANPAAAPFTAYYLAFTGCVAGAASAYVRTKIVGSTDAQTVGATLGSCLAGAVVAAGVGKISQEAATKLATLIRSIVRSARAGVPSRVASQVDLARASAATSVETAVIQAIPVGVVK
jgi:hypothetical protein